MPLPARLFSALALALAASLAAPARAEEVLSDPHDVPRRFAVTGVAADDVLNVRAAPDASAEILRELPPDARDVEVIDFTDDGAWALVPLPEGRGWASTRFLVPEKGVEPTAIPAPLQCLGTEPFWSLEVREGTATFQAMEDDRPRSFRPMAQAASHDGFVLAYDDGGRTRDLTVMRRACSDGMSDRPYGFAALVWDRGEGVLTGCCFLLPD